MSSFGRFFRVTTFGESHGGGVGCIVEGVPPCMHLEASDVQRQLDRRRPGQSSVTTDRQEADRVEVCSGTELGRTLGTPLMMLVRNTDHRPLDYSVSLFFNLSNAQLLFSSFSLQEMSRVPRPSHGDLTYMAKYGINSSSGGGRASARETIGRVAAGAVAEKWLYEKFGVEIVAFVWSVGTVSCADFGDVNDWESLTRNQVDANEVRCPNAAAAEAMKQHILQLKAQKDSTGGVLKCVCRNVPKGLGEPCFDKLEAMLAHAMLSIPSTKGFEVGSGFAGTKLKGSEHNDPFYVDENHIVRTTTNNSGGIQAGISNGENIVFSVAFKPPATIGLAQKTCNYEGEDSTLESKGRHDPCVCPRAVPIIEAMAALVIADAALAQLARKESSSGYEKIIDVI